MGRIAGVTAEDTRRRLLDAAARVFARRGYDGSSIAEITSEAGLSSGAIYARYGSKAELFVATLRAHSAHEVGRLLGGSDPIELADLLVARGAALDRRTAAEGSLLMEAIVAAKRDPKVARLLAEMFAEREALVAELVRGAQQAGGLEGNVAAESVSRFTLMLALGSLVVAAIELPAIDHDDWSALITALIDRFRTGGAQ
jgi:AcrR family transcriptional regulator